MSGHRIGVACALVALVSATAAVTVLAGPWGLLGCAVLWAALAAVLIDLEALS